MPKTTITETTEYEYDKNNFYPYAERKLLKKVKTTVIETAPTGMQVTYTPPYATGGWVAPPQGTPGAVLINKDAS